MRREVEASGTVLTAGELRAALEGVDDAAPVYIGDDEHDRVIGAIGEDLRLCVLLEDYSGPALWEEVG